MMAVSVIVFKLLVNTSNLDTWGAWIGTALSSCIITGVVFVFMLALIFRNQSLVIIKNKLS